MIKLFIVSALLFYIVAHYRNRSKKSAISAFNRMAYGPLSCSPEFDGYNEILPYLYEIYLDDKLVHNWVYANDISGMVIVQDGPSMRHAFGEVKYKYIGGDIVN